MCPGRCHRREAEAQNLRAGSVWHKVESPNLAGTAQAFLGLVAGQLTKALLGVRGRTSRLGFATGRSMWLLGDGGRGRRPWGRAGLRSAAGGGLVRPGRQTRCPKPARPPYHVNFAALSCPVSALAFPAALSAQTGRAQLVHQCGRPLWRLILLPSGLCLRRHRHLLPRCL